jgi:uncharacterized DUF497 family protein
MQRLQELLGKCTGFQWDAGNSEKNWRKHRVQMREAEEALRNLPITLVEDPIHSKYESRYRALGRTNMNRLLYVVFTIRGEKIRVISARDMDREETREYYEEST